MKGVLYSKALIASKYWEELSLENMNTAQWEAICDGCGRCCLHKFVDSESVPEDGEVTSIDSQQGEVFYTNITCYQLNEKTCACKSYEKRKELVPDCVSLNKHNLKDINFMPPSCSYRRMHKGEGLASWHPLLNKGKKTKMHELGITVRNKVISEDKVNLDDFEDYIVTWPLSEID
ncbi:YcgN family cysteine cluster protein [Glaciecola siphonariae]|uniref:YcgN family cysteine cluster protein n=1 Tax=Glaciecola siphonariae TaxID=521012 RepID=A0ABV9LTC7_9ALTE